MSNVKKILMSATALVLVAAISVGTTLALLKDTDSDVNVMTLGNVKIEQIEQEWNSDKTALVDFTQAKPILPVVGAAAWENETTDGGAYRRFAFNNAVDKYVSVKNTGRWDAYVRTYIALEMGSLEYDGTANSEFAKTISASVNSASGSEFPGLHWIWTDDYVADIGGKKYNVMVAVYDEALAPNVTTVPSLLQVYMKNEATNETVEKLDGNGNGTFDILVFSQACQADGFDDPVAALNSVFGDSATTNPWSDKAPSIPVLADDADGLIAALENGKGVVLTDDVKINPAGMSNAYGTTGINVKNGQTIDGNGNTLDIKGAGGTWDSGICTTGGLIKNLTVTGSFRGIFINHNSSHSEPVVLENVIIDGTTYTISCDQGMYQDFEAYNSTFNGWTSYAATLGNAKFENCKFGEGNGYAYCRPYAPTTFVGCDFEAGYRIDARAAVTFENCTIGGVALTADNLATLVVSNIGNASVK